jgi:hypothetical protein
MMGIVRLGEACMSGIKALDGMGVSKHNGAFSASMLDK